MEDRMSSTKSLKRLTKRTIRDLAGTICNIFSISVEDKFCCRAMDGSSASE